MAKNDRKSFRDILREEAPRSAWKLETKARHASWLAKIRPGCSSELYAIKHAALRQLFCIPAHAPMIRNAWTTARGFLVSVELARTGSRLHVPLDALNLSTQQAHAAWVMRCARGKWWRPRPKARRATRHSEAA